MPQLEYKAGDNVRLVDGRVVRIVRVFESLSLYDVKDYAGDHDRFDVLPEDIACRVRRATIWVDDREPNQGD